MAWASPALASLSYIKGGVPVIGGRPCHSAGIPDHVHQVINMTDEGRLDSIQ